MRTARRYLAREIYRSCVVVVLALVGLFTFFSLVDKLDRVNDNFRLVHLLYLELLDLPTRLYDLLPVGLLIGAILALAGLAQRHELVILRVSGVSAMGLLRMLWRIALPLVLGAVLLAELVVPASEIKLGEANLTLLGRTGGGRMESGYWFKEKTPDGERIINIGTLQASGGVRDVTIYQFDGQQNLAALTLAEAGHFGDAVQGATARLPDPHGERDGAANAPEIQLILDTVTINRIVPGAASTLADAQPTDASPVAVEKREHHALPTTLTPELLLSRVLTPERMSVLSLWRYIDYLTVNQLVTDRQVVAIWRKLIYPFTLLVMVAIAAPISVMQTRRGGVGGKVFLGILAGVSFFMLNQLSLNAGMLYGWPPWLTALGPNLLVLAAALAALALLEHRTHLNRLWQRWWPWQDTPKAADQG